MAMSKWFVVLAAIGLVWTGGVAEAGKKKDRDKKHTKVKVCSDKKVKNRTKKSCRYEKQFQGANAKKASLRTEPLERPSGDIWIRSDNLQEELRVNIYAADGSLDDGVLAQLDELFRCKRSNEVRAVDPRLFEHLSRIYDHFGKRITIGSGFRFQERTSSRHWHASAMDIRIKDVSTRELYAFAESLDLGGMGVGIYPHSGFVHIDFRAPGEPSFRWTDWSYPDGDGYATAKKSKKAKQADKSRKSKKSGPRKVRATRPTS
jgi:uncharacterized protein YcbK (DUF882 family)